MQVRGRGVGPETGDGTGHCHDAAARPKLHHHGPSICLTLSVGEIRPTPRERRVVFHQVATPAARSRVQPGRFRLVRVGSVERILTVEFGPSRSKRFRKAVEEAHSGAGECSELEPGSYRVRFVLGSDGRVHASLARLMQRVRNWRATEVYEGDRLL